jgi:hypothetical protein
MNTETKIRNYLAMLGSTADEVYERLLAEACYGTNKLDSCPVAIALTKHFGVYAAVSIPGVIVRSDEIHTYVLLPRSVQEFVWKHDTFAYPALQRKAA